jgi:hypothetical protein
MQVYFTTGVIKNLLGLDPAECEIFDFATFSGGGENEVFTDGGGEAAGADNFDGGDFVGIGHDFDDEKRVVNAWSMLVDGEVGTELEAWSNHEATSAEVLIDLVFAGEVLVLAFGDRNELAFAEWMVHILSIDLENAHAEQVVRLEKGELRGSVKLGGFWLANTEGFTEEPVGVQR